MAYSSCLKLIYISASHVIIGIGVWPYSYFISSIPCAGKLQFSTADKHIFLLFYSC